MRNVDDTEKVVDITTWLPPNMVMPCNTKMRMTFVDGALQIYGHQKEARLTIRTMRKHFKTRYDLEDHPEDLKVEWNDGEVCVTKLGDHWFRAQIIEMSTSRREAAVIYVDLGNVRIVNTSDLRIPRDFADEPMLAIRMVMDTIIPPNGDKIFAEHTIQAIQEEICYWNAGYVKVTSTRKVSAFPIPVKLSLVLKKGESKEYENFGQTLLECGLADNGEVDILNPDYDLHARVTN